MGPDEHKYPGLIQRPTNAVPPICIVISEPIPRIKLSLARRPQFRSFWGALEGVRKKFLAEPSRGIIRLGRFHSNMDPQAVQDLASTGRSSVLRAPRRRSKYLRALDEMPGPRQPRKSRMCVVRAPAAPVSPRKNEIYTWIKRRNLERQDDESRRLLGTHQIESQGFGKSRRRII